MKTISSETPKSRIPPSPFSETLLWGKETLEEEAKALLYTAENLGTSFQEAISILLHCQGKVVITGLGKSGHIAKKISATFSSCGTPSLYLHPAEALHGDLGILENNDVILALAYSGETYETLKVCGYAKTMGLKVIALTGKKDSSLAELSDATLDGRVSREVCPNELAPTSSTTVALALGDALAVTLMKVRNFTARDFARYHPEGLLGRKLSLVKEFIKINSSPVTENSPLEEVISKMSSPNYGVVAVLDEEGKVCGVITDGDLRRHLLTGDSSNGLSAKTLMTRAPKLTLESDCAYNAGKHMENLSISSLLVVDQNKKFKGILRLIDLVQGKIL